MSRHLLDAYDTPAWQVDALVDHVPAISGVVWEPCAGDGSLLAQLVTRLPEISVVTFDIAPGVSPMIVADMRAPEPWDQAVESFGAPDWIVTNPPFADAFPILQHAIRTATVGVAYLSRVTFIEPTRVRGPWLVQHPHDQRIVLERYSYTGDGRNDACTTEWLIFVKDWRILTPPFGISAHGYKPQARR